MKKNFLKIIIPVIIICAVIYGIASFYKKNQDQDQITLYGNIDIREVGVSFRVSGRLKQLFFDEGDIVKKEDLLATLENDTFTNNLQLAKANLDAAKANLDNAQAKFKRTEGLFKNDSASRQEYDNDKFALSRIEAQFEAEKTKLKISQTALDDTNLYAPSNAFVMTRAFEVGSMLSPSQTVYELSLTDQSYVRTYIDEKDLGKIISGMKVTVKTDSNSQYQGQIGFISEKAEFTPKTVETTRLRTELVYRLRIIIENPDNKLKQGMPVTIIIKL